MIKEITLPSEWNTFFNLAGSPSFLHSWEWGEFQAKLGYTPLRLGIYEGNSLVAIALVLKIKAKRANMLFIPHGPVVNLKFEIRNLKLLLSELLTYLKNIAQKEGYSFIRIAPVFQDSKEYREMFRMLGFRTAPIYMHAERLWVLDITKDEETLLKEMRKTTRYSIRKAEKEGVVIEKYPTANNQSLVNMFWNIYEETAGREGFTPYSKSFLQKEFYAFSKTGNAMMIFGKFKGKIEAAALIDFTKSTAFYHQGATTHSKIPVSYLLQWESIKEAKRRGCTLYNFWGTLQPGRTPKNWDGLSLFKEGFGGYQVDYVPTQDLVLSPKYWLTYLYELYLKWRRGV